LSNLVRFGVSIDENLIAKFDKLIKEENYTNRSEAIRDLIRDSLVKKEWLSSTEIAGAITLVYDHHKRGLLEELTQTQHDYHNTIISTQHIHLNSNNCLEVIIVRGSSQEVANLAHRLKSLKGVKHSSLTMTTTGTELY